MTINNTMIWMGEAPAAAALPPRHTAEVTRAEAAVAALVANVGVIIAAPNRLQTADWIARIGTF